MKMQMAVVGVAGMVLCGGCASSAVKKIDVNRGLEAFYTQPRTVSPEVVRPEIVTTEGAVVGQ